jgi:hypothetical protein
MFASAKNKLYKSGSTAPPKNISGNPVSHLLQSGLFCTIFVHAGVWRSWLARAVWDREVEGSSPFTPTKKKRLSVDGLFFLVRVQVLGSSTFCIAKQVEGSAQRERKLVLARVPFERRSGAK